MYCYLCLSYVDVVGVCVIVILVSISLRYFFLIAVVGIVYVPGMILIVVIVILGGIDVIFVDDNVLGVELN